MAEPANLGRHWCPSLILLAQFTRLLILSLPSKGTRALNASVVQRGWDGSLVGTVLLKTEVNRKANQRLTVGSNAQVLHLN
jgi:hypothetical protein